MAHHQLDPLWDELLPAEQARIVVLLVERVDIGADGLGVRLRMDGLGGLAHARCWPAISEMLRDPRGSDPREGDTSYPVRPREARRAEGDEFTVRRVGPPCAVRQNP